MRGKIVWNGGEEAFERAHAITSDVFAGTTTATRGGDLAASSSSSSSWNAFRGEGRRVEREERGGLLYPWAENENRIVVWTPLRGKEPGIMFALAS